MRKYVQRVVIYKCLQRYAQGGRNSDELKDEIESYEDYSGQCRNIKSLFPFCRIIITYGTNEKVLQIKMEIVVYFKTIQPVSLLIDLLGYISP